MLMKEAAGYDFFVLNKVIQRHALCAEQLLGSFVVELAAWYVVLDTVGQFLSAGGKNTILRRDQLGQSTIRCGKNRGPEVQTFNNSQTKWFVPTDWENKPAGVAKQLHFLLATYHAVKVNTWRKREPETALDVEAITTQNLEGEMGLQGHINRTFDVLDAPGCLA